MHNPKFSLDSTYVQIYTGEGKGKTTASLGLTMRHIGNGGSVLYCQFCKGDKEAFPSGEKKFFQECAKKQGGKFVFKNFGSKYKWEIPDNITDDDRVQFSLDYLYIYRNCHKYSLVVLDEIAHALYCGLIVKDSLELLINRCHNKAELVMTGRGFPQEVQDMAHLITEMKCVKHYWDIGITARKSIEY